MNISKSRTSKAIFLEIEKEFNEKLDMRVATRYESMNNESSADPKLSLKYLLTDFLSLRLSRSTAFSSPSMAQMFSSEINLGMLEMLTILFL